MTDSSRNLILTQDEAARRLALLAELQAALAGLGVRSVLARNHRLVLRWNSAGPFEPSGLTDPHLHTFTRDGSSVATTDGAAFTWSAAGTARSAIRLPQRP